MTCLDTGCGGGDVTVELARLVGPAGHAVGADVDETAIAIAGIETESLGLTNVDYRRADATQLDDVGTFDVVYARFLLSHLLNPPRALADLRAMLKPGGCIIVEDVDFSGYFCDPESRAFDRYIDLYIKAAQRRGGCEHRHPPSRTAL